VRGENAFGEKLFRDKVLRQKSAVIQAKISGGDRKIFF
jgi:hypothetical protein